jgi:hypothetical protein
MAAAIKVHAIGGVRCTTVWTLRLELEIYDDQVDFLAGVVGSDFRIDSRSRFAEALHRYVYSRLQKTVKGNLQVAIFRRPSKVPVPYFTACLDVLSSNLYTY